MMRRTTALADIACAVLLVSCIVCALHDDSSAVADAASTPPRSGFAFAGTTRSLTTRALASSVSSSNDDKNDKTTHKSPIPPPPPISMPVWSLAVPIVPSNEDGLTETTTTTEKADNEDTTTSMNIVTFATAVSVAPEKLWIVSLYHGTRTKDAFFANSNSNDDQRQTRPTAVLQLLRPQHKHLVPLLGKRSGYEPGYSKAKACAEIVRNVDSDDEENVGFAWFTNQATDKASVFAPGISLLPDCATYIQLELISSSSSPSSEDGTDTKSSSGSEESRSRHNTLEAGDHIVALCRVTATGRWDERLQKAIPCTNDNDDDDNPVLKLDHKTVLYTGLLRDEGIL